MITASKSIHDITIKKNQKCAMGDPSPRGPPCRAPPSLTWLQSIFSHVPASRRSLATPFRTSCLRTTWRHHATMSQFGAEIGRSWISLATWCRHDVRSISGLRRTVNVCLETNLSQNCKTLPDFGFVFAVSDSKTQYFLRTCALAPVTRTHFYSFVTGPTLSSLSKSI